MIQRRARGAAQEELASCMHNAQLSEGVLSDNVPTWQFRERGHCLTGIGFTYTHTHTHTQREEERGEVIGHVLAPVLILLPQCRAESIALHSRPKLSGLLLGSPALAIEILSDSGAITSSVF